MLKQFSRKLITLSVLCVALAAVSFSPASSTTKRQLYCVDVPMCTYDCCSGYWCCDRWGENCTCG